MLKQCRLTSSTKTHWLTTSQFTVGLSLKVYKSWLKINSSTNQFKWMELNLPGTDCCYLDTTKLWVFVLDMDHDSSVSLISLRVLRVCVWMNGVCSSTQTHVTLASASQYMRTWKHNLHLLSCSESHFSSFISFHLRKTTSNTHWTWKTFTTTRQNKSLAYIEEMNDRNIILLHAKITYHSNNNNICFKNIIQLRYCFIQ